MSFMISRETENVQSIAEVESAFQAITSGGNKPYVTKEDVFQVEAFCRSECLIHEAAKCLCYFSLFVVCVTLMSAFRDALLVCMKFQLFV